MRERERERGWRMKTCDLNRVQRRLGRMRYCCREYLPEAEGCAVDTAAVSRLKAGVIYG